MKELTLDSVGETVTLKFGAYTYSALVKVVMGIAHPKGSLFLFNTDDEELMREQRAAIRAFMKFCNNK